MKSSILFCIFMLMALPIFSQHKANPVGTITATRQTPVHDPVMIKEHNRYYIFSTGFGINVFSSADMKTWQREKPVFSTPPQWALEAVPGYKGHTWAPDISYHDGLYYLYYSVSVFGKNSSCIGLAINKTLDAASPDFLWKDMGMVIQSFPGKDNWNAIDPNLIIDDNKTAWLSFGSYWSGIKMIQLRNSLDAPSKPLVLKSIASRNSTFSNNDSTQKTKAIEAPFVFKKGKYFYLFVSWDLCCKGIKSTYKVVVGRSETVDGIYLDKQGNPMQQNGGSLLIEGDGKKWFGIGHSAVFTDDDGTNYFVAHGYDGYDNGRSKLIIKKMNWDADGWPVLE